MEALPILYIFDLNNSTVQILQMSSTQLAPSVI